MRIMRSASVIVSMYNQPERASLVLLALARQSVLPMEVLVADDGSSSGAADVIRAAAVDLPFPVRHVWQPDENFRAARSRNNAIHAASSEVIAFLDQDTLPYRNWLAVHLAAIADGGVSMGSVEEMGIERADAITPADVESGVYESWGGRDQLRDLGKLQRKFAYYAFMRRIGFGIKGRPAFRSSNGAAWRADLLKINGFDETYIGWGQEDDDLGWRLYLAGVRPVPVVDTALVCHMTHPIRHAEWRKGANIERYRRRRTSFRCDRGLADHPHADAVVTDCRAS